jgi:hypothetical protein
MEALWSGLVQEGNADMSGRPFSSVPGRDASRDRTPIDIAGYYYERRSHVAEDAALLRQLIAAVDWTNDLAPSQWAQWYSVALGFKPDLILELGRGRGNSTALFTQAAARLGDTRVVSLCQSGDWASLVAPRLARVVSPGWFDRVDARVADIISTDYEAILDRSQRVLLLWDAHGFEIAEVVLGEILPRLAEREHLVLMHDISDNRYAGVPRSYGGRPLWKGSSWQSRTQSWDSRVNIGWMNSIQDQVIALADFSARNDLEIGSADHEFATFFGTDSERASDMRRAIGDELFSTIGHWAFLSLMGRAGPFHFPAVTARRPLVHRQDVIVEKALKLPAAITTAAVAWSYAGAWAWQPAGDVPSDVQVYLRVRLTVDGGAIGVSLLTPDGKEFVERKVVASNATPPFVLLPVADLVQRGRLVIHTWDTPVSARVRVEELSLVW